MFVSSSLSSRLVAAEGGLSSKRWLCDCVSVFGSYLCVSRALTCGCCYHRFDSVWRGGGEGGGDARQPKESDVAARRRNDLTGSRGEAATRNYLQVYSSMWFSHTEQLT